MNPLIKGQKRVGLISIFSYSKNAFFKFKKNVTIIRPQQQQIYKAYGGDTRPYQEMDMERWLNLIKNFTENYVHFKVMGLNTEESVKWTKKTMISLIKRFFKEAQFQAFLFYYSGHADQQGRLAINNNCFISYHDIYDTWKQAIPDQSKMLLLIIDANHSGEWVKHCKQSFHFDKIAVQAVCRQNEQASSVQNMGSLFLINWIQNLRFNKRKHLPDQKCQIYILRKFPGICAIGLPFLVLQTYGIYLRFSNQDHLKNPPLFQQNPNYFGQLQNNTREGLGILWNQKEHYQGFWSNNLKVGMGFHKYKTGIYQGDVYYGQYVQNRREGVGIYCYANGDRYEGCWANNNKNGKGSLFFKKGGYYKGLFKENKRDGFGEFMFPDQQVMKCNWHQNELTNPVQYFYKNGDRYSGIFRNMKRQGKGHLFLASGVELIGDFLNEQLQGRGKKIYSNGDIYQGEFKNSLRHGKGLMIYPNGNQEEGEWINDVWNQASRGRMVYRFEDGIYDGQMMSGQRDGVGVMRYNNGMVYRGQWRKDKRDGKGLLYKLGGFKYEGIFVDDKIPQKKQQCCIL